MKCRYLCFCFLLLVSGFLNPTIDAQLVSYQLTATVDSPVIFLGQNIAEGDEVKIRFKYDIETRQDNPGESPAEYFVARTNAMRFRVGNQWYADDSYRLIIENGHPMLGDVMSIVCDFGGTDELYLSVEFRDLSGTLFSDESLPDQVYSFNDFDEIVGFALDVQAIEFLDFDGEDLIGSSFIPGDVNGDGAVNLLDVQPFVDTTTAGVFVAAADLNCDGSVDLLDLPLFVEAISGG